MYTRRRRRPLRGACSSGRFGNRMGRSGVAIFNSTRILLTWRRSRIAFYEVGLNGNVVVVELGTWIRSSNYEIQWGLLYDALTVVMCVVVTTVSSMVHLYSVEYMGGDAHLQRFLTYLSLFTFGMLVLVTSNNRVQRFVGWEAVGVCSYLLINFWYTRIQANKAAIKAMVLNRVGDIGLARGILRRYCQHGSREYGARFATAASQEVMSPIDQRSGRRRFVGSVGKSAQRGLHTWLPDAMEGPTPVSALIHAATMVTAGVFRRARTSPRIEAMPIVLGVITVMGAMTAFYAGTIGLVQNDRKRVIAYSTCSQLGYMVRSCGRSAYDVAVFHLANHAMFKALLFLSAGSVIHARSDEQDMRRMGGLGKVLPVTYSMILIGSVALMGFPFLTGYYSKDVILERALSTYTVPGQVAYRFGTRAACCTGFYSIRLIERTFRGEVSGYRKAYEGVHDAPRRMMLPLRVLCVGSVYLGWRSKDRMIGMGSPYWGQALETHVDHLTMVDSEFLSAFEKITPVCFGRFGGRMALVLYENPEWSHRLYQSKVTRKDLYKYRVKKWYFDKVYTEVIAVYTRKTGDEVTYQMIDRGVIERLGPSGLTSLIFQQGSQVVGLQTGEISHYTAWMVYGMLGMRRTWRRMRMKMTARVNARMYRAPRRILVVALL